MECGETLANRLTRGPIPFPQAILSNPEMRNVGMA